MTIMQSYLDDLSTAVLTGDWGTYSAHVAMPFTLVTETTTMVVDTEEKLRAGFDSFHDMLKFQRVTQYIRLVETAVDLGDTLISGRYVSHVIAGAHRIIPPFRSHMTLRLIGNIWCAAAITSSISNMQWPIQMPRVDNAMTGFDAGQHPADRGQDEG